MIHSFGNHDLQNCVRDSNSIIVVVAMVRVVTVMSVMLLVSAVAATEVMVVATVVAVVDAYSRDATNFVVEITVAVLVVAVVL